MTRRKKTPKTHIRRVARVTKKTPIERIFEKIVGRRMNRSERLSFHLKPDGE